MPWINHTDDDLLNLILAVDQMAINTVQVGPKATYEALSKTLRDRLTPDPDADRFYEAASNLDSSHRLSEPDEYQNPPFISKSENGAYVMAWIWVSNEDAGIRDIEIAIHPMKKAADGEGHTLADNDAEALFWDVLVKERDDSDDIDVLEEVENLPTRDAAELVASAFELKYPDGWRE